MRYRLNYVTLLCWFIANAVITLCFGVYVGMICLFPAVAPHIRALFFDGRIDIVVPYIIFALIVSSVASIMYYYDLYMDKKWKYK